MHRDKKFATEVVLELALDQKPTPQAPQTCHQAGCTFAQDGTCLEGLPDPLHCPHLSSLSIVVANHENGSGAEKSIDADGDASAIEEEVSIENWLPLPDGYELSLPAARQITGGHEACMVVLAGEPDAGKTTLIACLYEKFCEGPFASLQFAGSNTLLAFERACHLSRTSSEAEEPDTQPTKGLYPRFFHFFLRDPVRNESEQHLLLTDISGEAYQRATNHTEDAKKLSFIRRADVFMLLLDGERLASKLERQEVFGRGLMLLRSLTEAGMLDDNSSVQVAISKFDLLQPEVIDQNTVDFMTYIKSELLRYAGERYKSFRLVEIASRPAKGSTLGYAYGLDSLIQAWLEKQPTRVSLPQFLTKRMHLDGREADLFLWRHFAR